MFSDKSLRWFEPQHSLLAKHYFTHVWGSSYVVSGRAAGAITILPVGLLRFFANEGILHLLRNLFLLLLGFLCPLGIIIHLHASSVVHHHQLQTRR